jgi:hypothetical protein
VPGAVAQIMLSVIVVIAEYFVALQASLLILKHFKSKIIFCRFVCVVAYSKNVLNVVIAEYFVALQASLLILKHFKVK